MVRKRKREESVESQLDDSSEARERPELPLGDTEQPAAAVDLEPPSSQTLPSIGASQPLTEKNLRVLDRISITSNMAPRKTNEGASTPAGSASGSLGPPTTKALHEVVISLSNNRIRIEDAAAKKRYPEIVTFASQLISRKRHSDMDEETREEAVEQRGDYSFTNEDTFVREMWGYMHQRYRDKRVRGVAGSDIVDEDWTTETWFKANLGARWNFELRHDSVPRLETTAPFFAHLLANWPRIANPKPDLVYGIKPKAFTDTELEVIRAYPQYAEISPGVCFPFFAAEFKGSGGSMEEAEIQACRSGAAMVRGVRELNKAADLEKKDAGADAFSFAFTLAMIPRTASLYVHWAEVVPEKQVIYHMHELREYSLKKGDHYAEIRRDLNNLLDWGLEVRLEEAQKTLAAVAKKTNASPAAKKQKTDSAESGSAGQEA